MNQFQVKRGSTHVQVSAVQMALRSLRFDGVFGKPLEIDGVAGSETEHAIIQFQSYYANRGWYDGNIDGIFGPKCWAIILGEKPDGE